MKIFSYIALGLSFLTCVTFAAEFPITCHVQGLYLKRDSKTIIQINPKTSLENIIELKSVDKKIQLPSGALVELQLQFNEPCGTKCSADLIKYERLVDPMNTPKFFNYRKLHSEKSCR